MRSRATSSPFVVHRVNPYPFIPLSSAEWTARSTRSLEHLEAIISANKAREAALLRELTAAIGRHQDGRRDALLRARRRLMSGRPVARDGLDPASDAAMLTEDLLAGLAQERGAREALGAAAAELEHERDRLVAWASDADVQRSVALSSTDFAGSVLRLSASETFDKRLRKSTPAFVSAYARSIARVSPFSLFTAVHVGFDGPDPAAGRMDGPVAVRSIASASRLLYRSLMHALAAHAPGSVPLHWIANELISTGDDGRIRVPRRTAMGGLAARFDRSREELVELPNSAAWRQVLAALPRIDDGGVTWSRFVEVLSTTLGMAATDSEVLADKIRAIGLVVPLAPASDTDPEFDERWRAFLLEAVAADSSALAVHDVTRHLTAALPSMPGAERRHALDRLHTRWSSVLAATATGEPDAIDAVRNGAIHEDGYRPIPPSADPNAPGRWADELAPLFPLFDAIDDQRVFERMILNIFVSRYGPLGVCAELPAFAQLVRSTIENVLSDRTREPMEIFELDAPPELLEMRARARQLMRRWNAPTPSGVRSVPADDLEELARLGRRMPRRATASYAVFGQTSGSSLILNHVYGGRGTYLSRFSHEMTESERQRYASYVRTFSPAGTTAVQFRPVLGFNANLTPPLLEREIAVPNEPRATGAIGIDRLRLRADGDRLILEHAQTGEALDPVYLGFLVPFALPAFEQLLVTYWGTPQVSTAEFTREILERLRTTDHDVVTAPEIRAGAIVLARQRWATRRDALPIHDREGRDLFIDLNLWRRSHGLPAMVFVRPLLSPGANVLERTRAPKPVLVDFLSHLDVRTLAKRLERFPDELLIEPLNPDPRADGAGILDEAGAHATELYFEVNDPHCETEER